MLLKGEDFQIGNVVVEGVFVLVVDIPPLGNFPLVVMLPNVSVQESAARFGAVPIPTVVFMLGVGIPAIPVPQEFDHICR